MQSQGAIDRNKTELQNANVDAARETPAVQSFITTLLSFNYEGQSVKIRAFTSKPPPATAEELWYRSEVPPQGKAATKPPQPFRAKSARKPG